MPNKPIYNDPKHLFNLPGFTGAVRKAEHFLIMSPSLPLDSHCAPVERGVYALYYKGEHPLYQKEAVANTTMWSLPIYVGQARSLRERLNNHRRSIILAINLDIVEFRCRYVALAHGAVEDLVFPLEDDLVDRYDPAWNRLRGGFGNNGVGVSREGGAKSVWDRLHPGRLGVAQGEGARETLEAVLRKLGREDALDLVFPSLATDTPPQPLDTDRFPLPPP